MERETGTEVAATTKVTSDNGVEISLPCCNCTVHFTPEALADLAKHHNCDLYAVIQDVVTNHSCKNDFYEKLVTELHYGQPS